MKVFQEISQNRRKPVVLQPKIHTFPFKASDWHGRGCEENVILKGLLLDLDPYIP